MGQDKQTWANFLHIYQPPTQFPAILRQIAEESYFELTSILKSNPNAKMTLNINGSLTEMLDREGLGVLISEIKDLALRGQIELVGSAMYHPLLPKLPREEIKRQIELNHETNKKYFGEAWHPQGFFTPEMAYSKDVAEVVTQLGFKWMILSEYAFPPSIEARPDNSLIYGMRGLPMKVFFRDHSVSIKLAFGQIQTKDAFFDLVGETVQHNQYLLTAMDGETFGHHRPGLQDLLGELYRDDRLESVKISDLIDQFPKGPDLEPLPSSWGLEAVELARGIVYPRWEYPGNSIQARQWELTNLAIKSVWASSKSDPTYLEVRHKLDQALHSDQYWWAGGRPNWHFRLVEVGARMLKDVTMQASGALNEDRQTAETLYQEIVDLGLKLYGDRVIEVK
jgi:hypothetical protein